MKTVALLAGFFIVTISGGVILLAMVNGVEISNDVILPPIAAFVVGACAILLGFRLENR